MPSGIMAATWDRKAANKKQLNPTLHNKTTMRKVIAIGESVLDTVFKGGQPVKAMVGGRIANAAAMIASQGIECHMVSECATDSVGDIVVQFLASHGVDVHSVDRYTDGTTPFAAIFEDDDHPKCIVNYGRYPAGDRFNVVWPRIDKDDIVIYGSLYAVEQPQRERMLELLQYAKERKAILVCLPGLQHGIGYRITHVMPAIFENMDLANIIVTHDTDINTIFAGETVDEAFRNHFEFYDNLSLHIGSDLCVTLRARTLQHVVKPIATSNTSDLLHWQAGFVAALCHSLIGDDILHDNLLNLPPTEWTRILTATMTAAHAATI